MGFIEAYKRLEKLCGEVLNNERRVSAYIDEMINTSRGAYFVRDWDEDLKQLKHYRWIRNQIVHDPSCSEENMCSDADTQWIVDFHNRIMSQTDPLTMYRKATERQLKPTAVRSSSVYQGGQHKERNISGGCGIFVAAVWLVVVFGMIYALLKI